MLSRERISGWTYSSHATAYVARPRSVEEIVQVLAEARRRGLTVLARGAGFSYGDQILNANGVVIDLSRMDRILKWNPASGQMTVEPGVTFGQALECCLPDNWVVAAVPGVRHPTLGGGLGNNVHGKNAWRDGNLGAWIVSFTIVTADGRVQRCSREEHAELFQAAIGGLGLFGMVVEIVLQCKRIPSPFLEVRKWTVPNVEAMMDAFEPLRGSADYHIGWADCFATGGALGRGTIHAANFVEAPRGADPRANLSYISPYLFGVFPRTWVWPVVKPFFGRTLVRTVNTAKYWVDRATSQRAPFVENYFAFTFLLDMIPNWRQLFLPHGYLELEALVPFATCARTFRRLHEMTQAYGHPSHLAGIKSHRPDDFGLPYSIDGCSIGIDIPIVPRRAAELDDLFYRMNAVVLEAGGRTYLAKDDRLSPEHFRGMYPTWRTFDTLKRKYDPDGLFQSGMYRRLFPASG